MNWLQEMDTCFISVLKAKIIYYHTHCLLKNYLAKLPATGKKKKKKEKQKSPSHSDFWQLPSDILYLLYSDR